MRIVHRNVAVSVLGLALSSGAVLAQDCPSGLTAGLTAFDVGPYNVLAYVPESAVGKPAPVVVNLHPTGGTGLKSLMQSRKAADENGFVVMAPTGTVGPVFDGWTWKFPASPVSAAINTLRMTPAMMSSSSDRRWTSCPRSPASTPHGSMPSAFQAAGAWHRPWLAR